MAIEPDIKDRPDAIEAPHFEGDISYRNVSFGYEENKAVLEHVSMDVKKGETVAFVGPSGVGKTTLVNLLPRFYELQEGEILIDGQDIRNFTMQSLRRQIGVVQQEIFLFNGNNS